jgi:hypothetical protein
MRMDTLAAIIRVKLLSNIYNISVATVCIFQALFMGVPIIFIVEDQPGALLFVCTGVVVVVCFSILLLMFVPKIQAIHSNDTSNSISSFYTSTVGAVGAIGTGGTRVSMSGDIINNQQPTTADLTAGCGYLTNSDSGHLELVVEESFKPSGHSILGGFGGGSQSSGISPRPETAAEK